MQQIGSYRVVREIARGGMGVVFLAHDTRLARDVVLKVLRIDEARSRRRLQREARAMAQLAHPNVVPLLDLGEHLGQPYLVLPFIDGESLQDRLDREGPFPVAEAIGAILQVGGGLRAAHELGLVHRDLKPANLLFDARGNALLTDFGLVKNVGPNQEQSVSLSVKGRFLGTPGYWPREQAFGRLLQIGPPSDVYGLAATLYALLSGRPPRSATTLSEALSAFDDPVPSLAKTRPEVPAWLDDLLQACLQDDPHDRPTLTRLLERLADPDSAATRPAAPTPEGPSQESPSVTSLWGPVLVGALVCAAGAGAWWVTRAAPPQHEPVAEIDSHEAAPDPRIAEARSLARAGSFSEALNLLDSVTPDGSDRADVDLLRGKLLYSLGRFQEAQAEFEDVLQRNPECGEAHESIGVALTELGRYQEAIRAFDRAVELDYLDEGLLFYNRAAANAKSGRYAAAVEDCDRGLRVDPDYPDAYLLRGQLKAKLGRPQEGLMDLDRSLVLSPKLPGAHLARGELKAELKRYASAIDDYDVALRLNPTLAEGYNLRGEAKANLERYRDAIEDYTVALDLDPTHEGVHRNRGRALTHVRRFTEAIQDFDEALRLTSDAGTYADRGDAKAMLGQLEAAVEDFSRALNLDPTNALALGARGQTLAALGQEAEALNDLNRALELDPDQTKLRVDRAVLLWRLGRFEDSLADCEEALRRKPGDAYAFSQRGTAFLSLGQLQRAIEDFDRALSGNLEQKAVIYLSRARCNALLGRREAGARDLEQALKVTDETLLPAEVGKTRAMLGQLESALEDYDRAVVTEPDNSELHVERAVVKFRLGGRDAEGLADLERAMELDPSSGFPYVQRAAWKANRERYAAAIEDLDRGAALRLSDMVRAQIAQLRRVFEKKLAER